MTGVLRIAACVDLFSAPHPPSRPQRFRATGRAFGCRVEGQYTAATT